MTLPDPFATPSPQRDQRAPEQGIPEQGAPAPGDGYAAPGYAAAPDYAMVPQPAPALGSAEPYPQAAPYGTPAPARASTDGVSIAALVTGLLGLGVIAIGLGAFGLRRTAAGQRKGTWMAVVGLVLGTLSALVVTAAIIWPVALTVERESSTPAEPAQDAPVYVEGSAYGDDPYLDGLWDECAAGDDVACDDLYSQSPVGSEYEEFGDTCGERGRPLLQMWCEEGRGW